MEAEGFSAKPRQPDAVSVDAYHYSNTAGLTALDPKKAGSADAGRERRRFGMGTFGSQGGSAARVAFYVSDDGNAPKPESVVRGRNLYKARLDNLYDLEADPRGFAEEAGQNQDMLEEMISDAGFDGFLAPPQAGIDVPTAVVFDIGSRKVPVEPVEDGPIASRGRGSRNPQVDTPEFRRWFGDSKVVDENGEPLVVYHGTGRSFDAFDPGQRGAVTRESGARKLFFFTDSAEVASDYADYAGSVPVRDLVEKSERLERQNKWDEAAAVMAEAEALDANAARGQSVMPVYLSIQNPLRFDAEGQSWQYIQHEVNAVIAQAARRGHDGIVVENLVDDPGETRQPATHYGVFEPTQIKSATGNSGAFDPENPSIIASRGRSDTAPTGAKNMATSREREAEGRDPILREMTRANEETVRRAREALDNGDIIIGELVDRPPTDGISSIEEAALLIEKVRLRNRRDEAAKVFNDRDSTPASVAMAKRVWDNLEQMIDRIDHANAARGAEWGRLGQFRQRMMAQDYSLEAMETRLRKAKGGPLTDAESKSIADLRARMEKAEADAAAARKKLEDHESSTVVRNAMEQAIKEAMAQVGRAAGRPKIETMKARADAARKRLLGGTIASRSKAPAGVSPQTFVDLYHIGAYHVASGRTNLGSWVTAMKADLGSAFTSLEPYWSDIYAASKAENDAVDKVSGGKADSKESILENVDAENITAKNVSDLAFARIKAGERNTDSIIRGVANDLSSIAPDIDEAAVRKLFVEGAKRREPTINEDRRALNDLRAIVRLQEEIARVEAGGKRNIKSKAQASDEVRQLRARLRDALKQADRNDPQVRAAIQQARFENLTKQIADLEDQIATGRRPAGRERRIYDEHVQRLERRRDELRAELRAIDRPKPSPETRYQNSRATSIANQIEALQKKIKDGDYSRAVRVPRELNEANQKAAFELDKLRREFRLRQFHEELKNRSWVARYLDNTASGINLARAIMTSFDLSGYLRQGGFITLGHPVRGLKAVPDMLRAFASEQKAHAVIADIDSRPNAPLYRKYKLAITRSDGSLSEMEEAYMTRFLERMVAKPGQPVRNVVRGAANVVLAPVRGSGRAYTTLLNKLRADSFDAMAATLSNSGELTDAEGKAIANYINAATGRGTVPGMSESAAAGLNTIFFAPKLVASRFQLLAGQPLYGGSNRTRALIAQDYARFMAGLSVVYSLGYGLFLATGHDDDEEERRPFIETDPRSSSFGRMRFGDWFVDPLAGIAQVTTFLARTISGENKTAAGSVSALRDNYRATNGLYRAGQLLDKAGFEGLAGAFPAEPDFEKSNPFGMSAGGVVGSFVRSKLAPVPGAVVNTVTGENMIGQPTTPGQSVVDLVTPMTFGNLIDAMEDKGVPGGVALVMAEVLGMSVQYRDRAAMEAPDYQNMDYKQRREYSDYLRRVSNVKADIREIRELANSFPVSAEPDDIVEAVQAKADELGIDGVKVKEYSRRTRQRDEEGRRRVGPVRTPNGRIQFVYEKGSKPSATNDSEKSINEINKQIEDVLRLPMSNEELDSIYRNYLHNGKAEGDKTVVVKALANERSRLINFYMMDHSDAR